MLTEQDVAGIKELYAKATKEHDAASIQLLAEEAVQAELYGAIVAESMTALEAGSAEAVDFLNAVGPQAGEAVDARALLGLKA